jgi:hypothetical protein
MANKMKLMAEKYHILGGMQNNLEWKIPRIIPSSISKVAITERMQTKGL